MELISDMCDFLCIAVGLAHTWTQFAMAVTYLLVFLVALLSSKSASAGIVVIVWASSPTMICSLGAVHKIRLTRAQNTLNVSEWFVPCRSVNTMSAIDWLPLIHLGIKIFQNLRGFHDTALFTRFGCEISYVPLPFGERFQYSSPAWSHWFVRWVVAAPSAPLTAIYWLVNMSLFSWMSINLCLRLFECVYLTSLFMNVITENRHGLLFIQRTGMDSFYSLTSVYLNVFTGNKHGLLFEL